MSLTADIEKVQQSLENIETLIQMMEADGIISPPHRHLVTELRGFLAEAVQINEMPSSPEKFDGLRRLYQQIQRQLDLISEVAQVP